MAILHGKTGSVTFTNGYSANVHSFSLSITAETADATVLGATHRTRTQGLLDISGSYTSFYDGTTVLELPGDDSQGAAVFTGVTGRSVNADIIVTDVAVSVTLDGNSEVVTSFIGSGALGAAPTNIAIGTG